MNEAIQKSAQDAQDSGSNRRRFRNFLVRPKEQLKYGGYFVLISLASLLLIAVPGYVSLRSLLGTLSNVYHFDPQATELIRKSLLSWLTLAIFNALALAFVAFNVGVFLTHRIFGAVVPIRRLIGDLKQGQYTARVHLRTQDELHELADDLNELAACLDEKYGTGTEAR